jgi:hypothetical protein
MAARNRGNNNQQRAKQQGPGLTKSQKNQVKQLVQTDQEEKDYNVTSSGSISTTGVVFDPLASISQGTTAATRIGDEVFLKHLVFTLSVTWADPTNLVRILLLKWNANDNSDPVTFGKIFTDTTVPVHSDLILSKPNRFKVLHDQIVTVSNTGEGARVVRMKKKLNYKASFDPAANTGYGHPKLIVVSDSSAASHPGYVINYTTHFTDD